MMRSMMVLIAIVASNASGQFVPQPIKTEADFRGLSVVNDRVAWVSGTKGTFGRTTDGGQTWTLGVVPGAESLDFRDVEAFGEKTAYLLSAGVGEASRIYKTTDAGRSWVLQFQNTEPKGFFDALAFWDEQHGLAVSDPIGGKWYFVTTADGGKTWKPLPEKNRPAALENEGAFAASGTCLITVGERDVWLATGGAKTARLLHSTDRGQTWKAIDTPLLAGVESAGIFSVAFRDQRHGVIVGGDYKKPHDTAKTVASTTDGGKTWTLSEKQIPFRSAVAWADGRWVAIGTSGADVSTDHGKTWKPIDGGQGNAVRFSPHGTGWSAGPKGAVARYRPDAKK